MDGLKKQRNQHGGDIYTGNPENTGIAGDLNSAIIDLSSNINPGELPGAVYEQLPAILERARHYPDLEYRALRQTLANYLNQLCGPISQTEIFTAGMITPGNGASEVTDHLISLFARLLIPVPSFTEYEASALRHGLAMEFIPVYADLKPDGSTMAAARGKAFFDTIAGKMNRDTLLILTNPNNPDGQVLDKRAFCAYLQTAQAAGWHTLVDETFGEYLPREEMILDLLPQFPNLIVVKALTKFFGLPGLRLGYAVSAKETLQRQLEARQTPWSVGTFDEAIATIMLGDEAFLIKSQADNRANRAYLQEKLEERGLFAQVFPSRANFVMAELSPRFISAAGLTRFLRQAGILIRPLSDMRGLRGEFVRIAVKEKSKTDRLILRLGQLKK